MTNTISTRAYNFASKKHEGQMRKDGVTIYFAHPMAVVEYIEIYKTSKNMDVLKAIGYLHDTVEDTDTTYAELVRFFGKIGADTVMELSTDPVQKAALGKEHYLKIKMTKMTSYALYIKLCDRLHNINTLDAFSPEKREKYLDETVNILNYIQEHRHLTASHKNVIAAIYDAMSKYRVFA